MVTSFRKLSDCVRGSSACGELMRKPPQYLLLCWVALCRQNDMSLSREDRHTCPMQWCDMTFGDDECVELVNHVSECPKLCDGKYICPYCHGPEAFLNGRNPQRSGRDARREFFRHAFKAICRLGSKGIRKAIHPSRPGGWRGTRSSKKRRYRDEDAESLSKLPPELDSPRMVLTSTTKPDGYTGHTSYITPPRPCKRASRYSVVELSGTRSRLFGMDICPEIPAAELASDTPPNPSRTDIMTNQTSASASPVSSIGLEQWFDPKGFDSPISPTGIVDEDEDEDEEQAEHAALAESRDRRPFAIQSTLLPYRGKTLISTGEVQSTMAMRNVSRINPNIPHIDTSCSAAKSTGRTSLVGSQAIEFGACLDDIFHNSFDDTFQNSLDDIFEDSLNNIPVPFQLEAETRSPTKLLEKLRGLFNNQFRLSCAKISRSPMTPEAKSLFRECPSPALMFHIGYRGLRKLVGGQSPETFWEVLGLAHLAYASGLACEVDDLDKRLPEIHADLERWSGVITDNRERSDYLQLVGEMLAPQMQRMEAPSEEHAETISKQANTLGSSYNFSSRRVSTQSLGWFSQSAMQLHNGLQNSSQDGDKKRLHDVLRKGVTVQLCLQYLAGMLIPRTKPACANVDPAFEYLWKGIANSEQYLEFDAHNSHMLCKRIIDQLLETRGVEAFRPCIDNAAQLLSTVPRMTLRDIELYLIQEAKVCTQEGLRDFALSTPSETTC